MVTAQLRARGVPAGEPYATTSTLLTHRSDVRIEPNAAAAITGQCEVPAGLSIYRLSTLTLGHATSTEVHDDSGRLFRGGAHAGENAWLTAPHPIEGSLRYECRFVNLGDAVIRTGGTEGRDELCMVMAQVTPAGAPIVCVDDVLQR